MFNGNPNLRKLLFAKDKDVQKGIIQKPIQPGTPQVSIPHPINLQSVHVPQPKLVAPTASPSLPALPKEPKFGKIKNYLKPSKPLS